MRMFGHMAAGLSLMALAACQSASTTPRPLAMQAAQPAPSAATTAAGQVAATPAAAVAAAAPAQCAVAIAGPPPKPAKGADFGQATARNIGKGIGRSLISGIAGQVAGPLGGAVAGGLAANAIRSEHDMKGVWTATDGSPDCGCVIDVGATTNLQGKTADKGKLAPRNCGNALLASAARWTLGHSFTGYDAPLDLFAANGARVATLKRDGVDYFSGTLADGTPVTIWRQ